MTQKEFANNVRRKLRMSSLTLTDEDLLSIVNEVLSEVEQEVNVSDGLGRQILGVIGYTDLLPNEREYPFPPDLLNKIIGVEIKLNTEDEWVVLDQIDLTYFKRPTDEQSICSLFANKPQFDIFRESLWIYSKPFTNIMEGNKGLKIWYLGEFKRLNDLTDGSIDLSVSPTGVDENKNYQRGIPKSIQYWLVRYVVAQVKEDNEVALTAYETFIWEKLREIVRKLEKIDARQIVEFASPNILKVGRAGFDL